MPASYRSTSIVCHRPLSSWVDFVWLLTHAAIQEFSKRPSSSTSSSKINPHHVTSPTDLSLADCLSISDVVISAVPVDSYKVPTKALKDGCVCVNVAGEKNFEADVRERVSHSVPLVVRTVELTRQASIYVPSVGMMTIAMLQRNLLVYSRIKLCGKCPLTLSQAPIAHIPGYGQESPGLRMTRPVMSLEPLTSPGQARCCRHTVSLRVIRMHRDYRPVRDP